MSSACCSTAGAPPASPSRRGGEPCTARAARRGRPRGRRRRLAAPPRTLRHRRRRAARRRSGFAVARSLPRRRREPAGPSAAAADLQGRGRAHAQPRLRAISCGAPAMGARISRCFRTRPADDGALAARRLRALLAGLRDGQPRIPHPAALARQMGRGRCTRSPPSPRASAICARRAAAAIHAAAPDPPDAARDPAELPLDGRGPPRRRRRAAPDPPHRRAGAARPLPAAGVQARRAA